MKRTILLRDLKFC